jgi:hypothetical protein
MTAKKAIAKPFGDATDILACTYAIHHPTMENHEAPALIYLVFERYYHQRLLKYSKIPTQSPQYLFDLLHGVHPVPSCIHEYMILDPHNITAKEPTNKERFKDLIVALFCWSWTAYLDAKTNTLCQDSNSKNSANNNSRNKPTLPIAIEPDGVTAYSPKLAKAVHEQVAKSTKSLQAQ